MSNAQYVHGLMNELGPLVDRIEVIQQEAENGWAIVAARDLRQILENIDGADADDVASAGENVVAV